MNQELHNEYWRKRCELAERCLEESPCDPDITKGQIMAHKAYNEFLSSPTDTAIYTGFIELLQKNNMWYEFENKGDYYQISFWYNGTNFKHEGIVVTASTVYGCFESALNCLRDIDNL